MNSVMDKVSVNVNIVKIDANGDPIPEPTMEEIMWSRIRILVNNNNPPIAMKQDELSQIISTLSKYIE